jgi:hypothetical protein
LLQLGELSARLLNSQTNPDVWRKTIEPSQRIYAWVMNNHWGTNYRAYQDGPTLFRFVVRPHGKPDPAEATRFATGWSQPLVAVPTGGATWPRQPLLVVSDPDVLVSGLKPSDDGKAWIIRLFNAARGERKVNLAWGNPKPAKVSLSSLSEHADSPAPEPLRLPALGLVTLRAE